MQQTTAHAMPLPDGGFMPYLRTVRVHGQQVTGWTVCAGIRQPTRAAALDAATRHLAAKLATPHQQQQPATDNGSSHHCGAPT